MTIRCSLFLATVLGALAAVSGSRAIELARRKHGEHERPINHVFIIVLENEGFNKTFGPTSEAPYLSKELTKKGVLLAQYFGTSHASLGNYVAMISGQAATPETRSDCQVFADFVMTGTTPDGQAIGSGCVYPREVKTLADQLSTKGRTWRGYMEDMGNDATREAATCGHGHDEPCKNGQPGGLVSADSFLRKWSH